MSDVLKTATIDGKQYILGSIVPASLEQRGGIRFIDSQPFYTTGTSAVFDCLAIDTDDSLGIKKDGTSKLYVKPATEYRIGGIKTGYNVGSAVNEFPVNTDSSGNAYVKMEYANTKTPGTIKATHTRDAGITTEYIYEGSELPNRYYGVEVDYTGKAFVYVPWQNSAAATEIVTIGSTDVNDYIKFTGNNKIYNVDNANKYDIKIVLPKNTKALISNDDLQQGKYMWQSTILVDNPSAIDFYITGTQSHYVNGNYQVFWENEMPVIDSTENSYYKIDIKAYTPAETDDHSGTVKTGKYLVNWTKYVKPVPTI